MQLSKQALEELREAYQASFGEELSATEAEEMAGRLLRLFALIARPLPPGEPGDLDAAQGVARMKRPAEPKEG